MNDIVKLIIETNDLKVIKKSLDKLHEYEIAQILLLLDEENRKKIYSIYDNDRLAEIISYLDEFDAKEFLEEVSVDKKVAIINEMEPDDANDLLQETDKNEQDKILKLIDKDLSDDIIELREYEEDTAGAFMTTHFISVNKGVDIKVAMRALVQDAPNVESINTIFVTDSNDHLQGEIELKKLIVSKSPCLVDDIMNSNFKFANVDTNIEEVTKLITDYDIYDLPILDDGVLKGIITMDDAIDSLVDEASEDYARFAGLTTDQEKNETFWTSIKKRIPWLAVLLVLDLFVPLISSSFDFVFSKQGVTIFVIFQPIILGLAGNSAMQSLGVTIRIISNKLLESKKAIVKYLSKELLLGLLLGITLGVLCFGLTYVMLLINSNSTINILLVSFTVGVSTMGALLVANFIGAIIPIFFYKVKLDPAVASGPFITTIVDVISVVLYFVFIILFVYNL